MKTPTITKVVWINYENFHMYQDYENMKESNNILLMFSQYSFCIIMPTPLIQF